MTIANTKEALLERMRRARACGRSLKLVEQHYAEDAKTIARDLGRYNNDDLAWFLCVLNPARALELVREVAPFTNSTIDYLSAGRELLDGSRDYSATGPGTGRARGAGAWVCLSCALDSLTPAQQEAYLERAIELVFGGTR